nr:hypothetical protein [Tanacetum cinerariifolium]
MFTPIKLVSRHQNTQQYGAILPIELTNEAIRNFESYKEYYAIASGDEPLKTKASVRKKQSSFETIITMPPQTAKGKRLKTSAKVDKPAKEKQPAKTSNAKGLTVLSEVALAEAEQMMLATKRSLTQTHIFHANGSGADEGTSIIPGVPDVPTYESDDEEISWKSSEEDDDEVKISEHDDDVDDQCQQQSSSMSSRFVSNMLNPSPDTSIDFIFESTPRVDVPVMTTAEPPLLSATTLPPPTILIISHKIIKEQVKEQVKVQVSKILPKIEKTVNEQLKAEVLTRSSNSSKTSHAIAADLSELELKKILIDKMKRNKSIHRSDEQKNLYKALVDAYECDKLILDPYGDTITLKRRRHDEDKDEEPSEKTSKTSGKSTEGSKSHHKTANECVPAEEPMHTTQDLEEPAHKEFETGATDDQPMEEASQHPHCNLAKKADSRTSFNELMDTPVDFSAFVMNRLKVDNLTPELLAGPTYELMKGSCKSLMELEFFLEEVYKATANQLDWYNPEGQQYPHDLLKPLPLISNSWGRRVIPFDHFINNDFEYLCGGVSSQKYTTSVTKTKATDYGHIKWIEDLVPRTMWSQVPKDISKGFAFNTLKTCYFFCVEDLQLGVESYQKKLNLKKPDTHGSYLKRKEAYTAYSNLRGFIYHNKDKQNILIRIDELHKFSDGTLNDVQTTLDDRLKGIRMQYLPQTIWRPTMYLNLWSYKAVRHRYSNPMIQPEQEGSTHGYPLVSVEVLRILKDEGECTEGTSDSAAATADTTIALSTTFASASTIAPISVDDYEVIGADDQAVADGDTAFFPNVDDVELNIP